MDDDDDNEYSMTIERNTCQNWKIINVSKIWLERQMQRNSIGQLVVTNMSPP